MREKTTYPSYLFNDIHNLFSRDKMIIVSKVKSREWVMGGAFEADWLPLPTNEHECIIYCL